MKGLCFFILLLFFFTKQVYSKDFLYILDDKCINILYEEAKRDILNKEIKILKDSRGLILRIEFDNENEWLDKKNFEYYKDIEYFLAKIQNPAIIEVHVESFEQGKELNLKKWEVSTVIANRIEDIITKPLGTVEQKRINSIGYGEFLPAKNTSNNGGKLSNRVDIIILCNISGE